MENVGTQVVGASGSGSFFTPLLISMAGIVFTTLAIVAYHFLVVKYFLRRRQRQMQLQFQASLAQQPATSQSIGVDEKVLNTIPILTYSMEDGEIFRMDQSECVICLGDLEDGDLVRLMPSCKHVFHNPCIETWFMGHSNCPVCRSAIDVPIVPVSSTLPVEYDHDHDDQVRDQELEEAGPVQFGKVTIGG
ncbi:RING-H2 finger protein ATL52-like isoform X2 [Malus sylvestris]|uniref:RING-H2 finger protein ATL39-like n=1 Tax=Malus domestica TaxID=3750 RepID=UPI0021ABF3AF|nr:RING-H2 finger protein ATL52-like isoform X2 [Malus sylvestris]